MDTVIGSVGLSRRRIVSVTCVSCLKECKDGWYVFFPEVKQARSVYVHRYGDDIGVRSMTPHAVDNEDRIGKMNPRIPDNDHEPKSSHSAAISAIPSSPVTPLVLITGPYNRPVYQP